MALILICSRSTRLISQEAAMVIRRYVKGDASFSWRATATQVQIAISAIWLMRLGNDSARQFSESVLTRPRACLKIIWRELTKNMSNDM